MRFLWGTVDSVAPLRVLLDGDTLAVPVTPDSLIDYAALVVSDRVRCEMSGNRLVILGRWGGLSAASTSLPGAVELATDSETIAGLDAGRAVTPAGLAAVRARPMQGVIPSSVAVGSGTASVDSDGLVSFTGVSSISLNDVFTAAGADATTYEIEAEYTVSATSTIYARLRGSASDRTTLYSWQWLRAVASVFAANSYTNDSGWGWSIAPGAASAQKVVASVTNPENAVDTLASAISTVRNSSNGAMSIYQTGMLHDSASASDGLTVYTTAGTMTGTIKVARKV